MNTINIIIGNICSLLAMVTDTISSTRKTTKGVLLVQSLSQLIYCTGTIVLKGYSSSAQNIVSIFRNFAAIKKIESKALERTLLILGVVLGIACNNLGLIGYLPIIANLQYTWAVFHFKDNDRALKISFAICVALFVVFNGAIYNVVGVFSNLVVLISTIIVLLKPPKIVN